MSNTEDDYRIYEANKAEIHARQLASARRHRATKKAKDTARAWRLAHEEYARTYYFEHKEIIAAQKHAWYVSKKAKAKEDINAGTTS